VGCPVFGEPGTWGHEPSLWNAEKSSRKGRVLFPIWIPGFRPTFAEGRGYEIIIRKKNTPIAKSIQEKKGKKRKNSGGPKTSNGVKKREGRLTKFLHFFA